MMLRKVVEEGPLWAIVMEMLDLVNRVQKLSLMMLVLLELLMT